MSVAAGQSGFRARRATLADVARDCGLDKSTISKALNLPPDQFILADTTRKRIMEAIERLGYRPSRRAQALARGETRVVGLVYHQGTPPSGVYTPALYAISDRLEASGYSLQFFGLGDDQERWADLLGGEQFDAVVAISRFPEAFGEMLTRSRLPTVLMNLNADLPVDRVMVDDDAGAVMATRHLLDLGHRKVVFYGDASVDPGTRTHFSYGVRLSAYQRAMWDAGLTPLEVAGPGKTSRLVDQMLSVETTGVVVHSHVAAVCLLHECWRRGLRVPEDLSVICFNDEFPVSVTIPPLTTVSTITREMGLVAIDLLLKRLESRRDAALRGDNHDSLPPKLVVLPEKLVVRGSTAPLPRES